MKRISWIILGLLALQAEVRGAEVDSAEKLHSAQKGAVTVQQFNLGELDKIQQHGYEPTGGGEVLGIKNSELLTEQYCVFNRDNFPARPVRLVSCVIVIETILSRDAKGAPVRRNEDALQINFNGNDLGIYDSGDTYCASNLYPERSVFALGLWKWRKSPEVGGYAYSFRKAWMVDPESKKFKEIPTSSVKCEVNEDRD